MNRRLTLIAAVTLSLAVAGCASADKNAPSGGAATGTAAGMTMSGTSTNATSAGAVAGSDASMSGMTMTSTKVVNAKGQVTVVPIKTIDTAYWKDMRIQAQEMTPVPFYVYNGVKFVEMKPTKQTSFHLMVMLNDRHSGYAIPYATVWVEIFKHGKMVFNERQWPMVSEYMGSHYGNDVALPGPGTYQLKLLVSAPVAALHQEYDKMWVGTHTVASTFTWK